MGDCIFCRIVNGDAPAHVVREDARTLAFLDIAPVAEGHTLVIPKAHCDDLFDADPDDLRAVMDASREIAHALERALHPDGLGVHQLSREAAGQTVFHYHMHLIPRRRGAKRAIHGREPAEPARLARVAAKLRAALEEGP